ncbi:MAG TPA: phospholipid carrier-dependent glycosyltransferase [Nocardioidaceae bacterium]|nr:phospholipid carrier-dependent glycosyltransferase [Nocardioidaceae bacterium]
MTAATQTPRRTTGLSRTADGRPVPSARSRLAPAIRGLDRRGGWVATLAVTLLAGFLRLWHLGTPRQFLFDETYYAKDAWSLLQHGYVTGYVDGADEKILDGRVTGIFTDGPSMIVHPEIGKWLIATGEWAFGMNPFGWRFAAAVVGTLMVLVMVRLARRLTGSTLLGCTAGLLLCVDGLQFVMSRLALLDVFMAFFLLSAVSCLVADRDWGRLRLARLVGPGGQAGSGFGPVRGLRFRPWRLAAGVLFGLAVATKWNALFPLAAFGLLVWAWDAGARRSIGVRQAVWKSALVDALPAFGYLVLVGGVVYVASWTGWLLHAHAYETTLSNTQYGPYWGSYLETDAHGFFAELAQSLRSLWNYHQDVFTFHTQALDDAEHTYQSNPAGWLILNRPVGVDAQLDIQPGAQGCAAPAGSTCLRQVLLLGTPALWWGGVPALLYAAYAWVARRDWRYGVAVVGVLASWLPWLRYDDRPIFSYYAVAIIPFTVLAVTLIIGRLIGGARASSAHRLWGTAAAGAFVLLVVVNFAWFWPIYTDQLISTPEWLERIWFRQWI